MILGVEEWVTLAGWARWRVVAEDVKHDETKMVAQLDQLSIKGGYEDI